MEWLNNMNHAIDFIEQNLDKEIDFKKVAQIACCSVYHFQRMFSYIANIPLTEYVRRRRMTLAAFDLQNSSVKIIDLALKYGYDSPEAFSRAFLALHGVTPTTARKRGTNIKAYPRITFQITVKGDSEMNYRIEQKEAFQVYGIERIFDTQDCNHLKDVPNFWMEALCTGEYDRLVKSTGSDDPYQNELCAINSICGYRDLQGTKFSYMLFAFRTTESTVDGYKIVDIPESTWAIFRNEPHSMEDTSTAIQTLNSRIYTDWLPTANYDKLDGYELEMYYQTKEGNYYEEAWVRVIPKR
jgi:AraC family transcriptional regulator